MQYKSVEVISNKEISKDIFVLKLNIAADIKPGQFFMLRAWEEEPVLSRPISVHSADENSISFAYLVKGRGTKLLSRLKPGDQVNILGPSGNGIDVNEFKGKIALISGGIGIAPLLQISKSLKGTKDLYCGFGDTPYLLDDFKPHVNNIIITTDSGAVGYKGYVTDVFNPAGYDVVICCGPEIMMKKIVEICTLQGVPVFVLMENKMACGVGACLGCTCETKEGKKRVCKDGPVFKGTDVIFNA